LAAPLAFRVDMGNEIIDLTKYMKREPEGDLPRGAMALWGADGERSRFALPLWRIIYLAQAERGVICSRVAQGGGAPEPFVALDLAHEPARIDLPADLPTFVDDREAILRDLGAAGVVVYLGRRADRIWSLVVDGVVPGRDPLDARAREDILFLAGECAGLLFIKELADLGDHPSVGEPDTTEE
jgi:hypothetical protein